MPASATALAPSYSPPPVKSRPQYDYIILPLLSLSTVVLMFALAELGSRVAFPADERESCLVRGPHDDDHMKANCTERLKNAEGPWVTYRYNECGYRSDFSCGPKPPNTIRMALLGSSITQGLYTPYEQTFGVRAAQMLSGRIGRRVEVQNLAVENLAPYYSANRLDQALRLKPDVIVFAVTSYDLQLRLEPPSPDQPHHLTTEPTMSPLKQLQKAVSDNSRAVLAAGHFYFADSRTYFRLHVQYGDNSNLFQAPLSKDWQERLQAFQSLLTSMEQRCREAGVPLIFMGIPSRAQAILVDGIGSIPGIDSFAFDKLLQQSADQAGCLYADSFAEFQRTPHSDTFFYPLDVHPSAAAHEVLAQALMRTLAQQNIPDARQHFSHRNP